MRTRHLAKLTMAVLVASMGFGAPAAGARTTGIDKPIYFVHGINVNSATDCDRVWKLMITRFNQLANTLPPIGPKIPITARTVGYYHGDTNCNTPIYQHGDHSKHYGGAFNAWHRKGGGHTVEVRIEHLGYHLAWDIYNRYSKRGKAVDVVAHSMGGLLIRYALMQTGLKNKDFPPYLRVEDVVTMGTPHGGSRLPESQTVQDQQMRANSTFLQRLARHGYLPQGRGGTEWLTMGSGDDKLVSADSAAGSGIGADGKRVSKFIGSQFKILYLPGSGIGHSDYYRADPPEADAKAIVSLGGGPFTPTEVALWPVSLAFRSILNANI